MPNITAAKRERLPNTLPNIVAICTAVLKDPDSGTALVDVSDGKTFGNVEDENERVDEVKLEGLNEVDDNDVVSGRVWVLLVESGMSWAPEFEGN